MIASITTEILYILFNWLSLVFHVSYCMHLVHMPTSYSYKRQVWLGTHLVYQLFKLLQNNEMTITS